VPDSALESMFTALQQMTSTDQYAQLPYEFRVRQGSMRTDHLLQQRRSTAA